MVTVAIPSALRDVQIGEICVQAYLSILSPRVEPGGGLMVRILSCLIAIVILVAPATHAQQISRLDAIVKRGTLRVGMTGDYLPFSYFDKTTSTFKGFDVDMAEALARALGVKVEYVHTAWPQLAGDFEADRFDV